MPDDVLQFGTEPSQPYTTRVSVYVVAFDDQGRLLVLNVRNKFHLPGGGIDEGEDPLTAVQRETFEEAGCTLKELRDLGKANQFFETSSMGPLNKVATFFQARTAEIDSKNSIEADHKIIWLTPEEFLASSASDFQKWAVEKALPPV